MDQEQVGELKRETRVRPDAKTQRYDRQLRLWASSGQSALENAHILVLNGTSTATSTLKNLVLPGIGSFTVLDPEKVREEDVGNNFFLQEEDIGKSRAQAVVPLLMELNDRVMGEAVEGDPVDLLKSSPDFFTRFSLVIAVGVPDTVALPLSDLCWERDIPLMLLKSAGFLGEVRIQAREHLIVETHPENVIELRLDRPFPELLKYVRSFDFDTDDMMEHGHIPYVVILVKYLEEWKGTHDGKLPSTYAEKNEFKQMILAGKRNADEENFDEALAHVWRACMPTKVPSDIENLFDDAACENVSASSPNFWLLLRAVRDFVRSPDGGGVLPLPGSLPDMKSTSSGYVLMQHVYRTKAKADLAGVTRYLAKVLEGVGLAVGRIPPEEVETFVKHAGYLKVIRGRSLRQEREHPKKEVLADLASLDVGIESGFADPRAPLVYHLAFLAGERFFGSYGRYPGAPLKKDEDKEKTEGPNGEKVLEAAEEDWETDVQRLVTTADELWKELGIPQASENKGIQNALREIARSGYTDLPNTAALLGGLASQEAIKLVTKQYVTVDHTVVWDGTRAATAVVAL